ncbi:GNAT family N-acetyltransferase [Sphingobacterium hungaricum]
MITLRKATKNDASALADLMLLAMDEIVYYFIGDKNPLHAKDFLMHFISLENNQYSYENSYVAEENKQILGQITLYDGKDLSKLREPIKNYLSEKFKRELQFEDETSAGEIYIDTLSVFPQAQGKGIGRGLLNFSIQEFAVNQNQVLGLLVEKSNPNAKKLYIQVGFKMVNEARLFNKEMEHLQFKDH